MNGPVGQPLLYLLISPSILKNAIVKRYFTPDCMSTFVARDRRESKQYIAFFELNKVQSGSSNHCTIRQTIIRDGHLSVTPLLQKGPKGTGW